MREPNNLLQWSLAHRFFHGQPMALTPALRGIYEDTHPFVVIQKAAQIQVSEYMVNTALWAADTLQGSRGVALFVMPTEKQVDDFSQARFDKAISDSSYLQSRLLPPPPGRRGPARQNLKKIGDGYIYLRGSESRRQLTSVDADVVLLDEFDLMHEGTIETARKRLASSKLGWLRLASTPRLPETGVNELFLQSDQRRYYLPCQSCGERQTLEWPINVDCERFLVVCRQPSCRAPIDVWAQGEWVAGAPGNDRIHGYHLNRLYSPMANLNEIVWEGQATSASEIKEFQNSTLGETFVPPGGHVTLDTLDRCRREYELPLGSDEDTYMGVDVGVKLHVVVRQLVDEKKLLTRALFIGELDSFDELSLVVDRYHVKEAVIDALPETRAAREFAQRGRTAAIVRLAYYDRSQPGFDKTSENRVRVLHLNRTEAIDEMFHAFGSGTAELPGVARQLGGRVKNGIGEYYRQMMAMKRTLEQTGLGDWVSRYSDGGKADHFAHAETYCLAAIRARHIAIKFIGG